MRSAGDNGLDRFASAFVPEFFFLAIPAIFSVRKVVYQINYEKASIRRAARTHAHHFHFGENFCDMNTRTLLHRRSGGVMRGANTALSSPSCIYIYYIQVVQRVYIHRGDACILNSTLSLFTTSRTREKSRTKGKEKRQETATTIYIYIEGERKAKTSKAPGVAQLLSTLHSAPRRHRLTRPFAPLFHTKNARFNDSESEIIKTKTRSVMDLMNFTIWKSYKKMYTLIIYIQKNRVHETK